MIDALHERGLEVAVSARDAAAVKHSSAEPVAIAEVYDAVAHGQFGDDFMRKRLSIHEAVDWVNAYAQRDLEPRERQLPEAGVVCTCEWTRQRLKEYPNFNPMCELHGDVRELGNTA